MGVRARLNLKDREAARGPHVGTGLDRPPTMFLMTPPVAEVPATGREPGLLEDVADRTLATRADLTVLLSQQRSVRVATVNLQHLALAARSQRLAGALMAADYFAADGWPVQAFLRSRGLKVDKVTGKDLCADLAAGRLQVPRVLIVGARTEPVADFRSRLQDHGIDSSWIGGDLTQPDLPAIETCLEFSTPLTLICMDTERGEVLAAAVRALDKGTVVVQVGGGVDMAVAYQRPAPRIAVALRCEWLWRFALSPRRLGHRYFVVCLPYFITVLAPEMLRSALRAVRCTTR